MAHKTFISYKFSDATALRNRIISSLGVDATYYQGETSLSPSMNDLKTSTIKSRLSDMIYCSTVLIIIVSQNMIKSEWMDWEIKYALREVSRSDRKSYACGMVCVVQKDPFRAGLGFDPYSWAKIPDGRWSASVFFDILLKNMNNKKSWYDSPISSSYKSLYDSLSQNYIDIVTEDDFLKAPIKHIDRAFEKSEYQTSYSLFKV